MTSRNLIPLLLALDLGLGAWLAVRTGLAPERGRPGAGRGAPPGTEARDGGIPEGPPGPEGPPRLEEPSPWQWVASTDLTAYVTRLRQVGCPEETIEVLIVAEVNRRFADREWALKGRREDRRPWEAPPSHALAALRARRQARALFREKKELLVELLGREVPLKPPELARRPGEDRYEAGYLELPAAKRDRVRAIQEEYWEKADELEALTLGTLEAETRQELRRLQAERRGALARLLTTRELEDFDLRTSSTAEWVRSRLQGLEADDEELRAVFRTVRELEEARPTETPESGPGANFLDEVFTEGKIRAALGEDRYAELELSRTPEFRNLERIARESRLTRDLAVKAYRIQDAARTELRRLEEDTGLPDEARQAALEAVKSEAEGALLETLGRSGFLRFKESDPWSRRAERGER